MLQLCVPNISSASVVFCIQVFYVLEVESPGGAQPRRRGMGAASRGLVVRASSTPRILRTAVLVLMLALGCRLPRDRGGSPDSRPWRERRGPGERAVGAACSASARDEDDVGAQIHAFVWMSGS